MYEAFELPGESFEFPGETEGEWEFGNEGEAETLEGELAQELLEVTTEAELDRFLGKLASGVMKGASTFLKSPIGKTLGGVLKNVAKTALPAVGGALGSLVAPGVGTAIGAKLGSLAGGLLEAGEAEAMGEAEAEYEAAQRYVRFARASYSNAARAPRNLPPRSVVRAASVSAARSYAPSLLRSSERMSPWRQRRPYYPPTQPSWGSYEPAPWSGDDGTGGYGADPYPMWGDGSEPYGEAPRGQGRPVGPQAGPPTGAPTEGRWVRRGRRIVVLGV